jgi:glutamine amidotransferase
MLAILNSGAANIRSVENALKRLGVEYFISDKPSELSKAERIIFPGVGHAAAIMQNLQDKNLVDFIRNWKKPFLGICLGMQVLFASSDEGETDCLGIIPGVVKKFAPTLGLKIPQMGWNQVDFQRVNLSLREPQGSQKNEGITSLFAHIKNKDFFYFVHSYRAVVGDSTIATTTYGENFSAVVQKDNFFGVQFHPEKSGKTGAQLLKNFCLL